MFDSDDFNRTLFFPRRTASEPPAGSVDLVVDVDDAVLHLRVHRRAGTRCTILLFHGNGEVVADYDDAASRFAAAGADLAVVDYRGYGRSTGVPTLRAIMADAGVVVDALVRAERDAHRTEQAAHPLLVMGRSLGSACANDLYGARRADVAAFILESGFTDLGALIERRRLTRSSDDRDVDGAARAVFDPVPKLRRGVHPLLILHGASDSLIDVKEARVAYASAGAVSDDKELVILEGKGHNDVSEAARYWTALAAFVTRAAV